MQRWTIDATYGTIANVGCPDLTISAASTSGGESSLTSSFFTLENLKTYLSMGLDSDGTSCQAGEKFQLQTTEYGNPNQQFYLDNDDKLVNVVCPGFAVGTSTNCESASQLELVSKNDGYAWQFDSESQRFETSSCNGEAMAISVGEGGRRLQSFSRSNESEEQEKGQMSVNEMGPSVETGDSVFNIPFDGIFESNSRCGEYGSVDCVRGKQRGTSITCATACNGKCCVGYNACSYFTGTVCMVRPKLCLYSLV